MKSLVTAAALLLAGAGTAQISLAWTASGNVEGHLYGAVDPNFNGMYSVGVSGIPAGAIVQKAFLYHADWNNPVGATAQATVNGISLGPPIGPYRQDNMLDSFRWDITPMIVGNGTYNVNVLGPLQSFGTCIGVVYSHPSLPSRHVSLHDGGFNLGDIGAETQSFSLGNPQGGAGRLEVYTQGDDNQATGEQLLFNGSVVGGPFDGNLGTHASIVTANVNVLTGSNTAGIFTPADQFGWHVALLSNVPEPATFWGFAGAGLLAFALRKRR